MENVKVLRYIENISTGRLSIILGKHAIKELQKTATLGTARVFRKVLMCKFKTYFTCYTTLRVAQIVNTEQLQPCIL